MTKTFRNASDAFDYYYDLISTEGHSFAGTQSLFNVGFVLENPLDRVIDVDYRKFSPVYADSEWRWYLSGDPNVDALGRIHGFVPAIWHRMVDWKNEVRSNYGWQWQRNDQLQKVIQMLQENPETRQATVSIYDGKEIDTYRNDTPCTYAIQFTILDGRLNMAVYMRSNDLWFGFCNDQYCFSKLQEKVAGEVGVEVGTYFHSAHNFHIYDNFLGRKPQETII